MDEEPGGWEHLGVDVLPAPAHFGEGFWEGVCSLRPKDTRPS